MPANTKARELSISLVGSGNLARVLGAALRAAGFRIEGVAARANPGSRKRAAALARKLRSQAVGLEEVCRNANVIWLCHTDDALAATARKLARQSGWPGKTVFHSSGALTSGVLAPLRTAGAHVASLHPMMTFVPGSQPKLKGIPFAVEGDGPAMVVAKQVIARLGGVAFKIKKENKVLYHALGSFSSPLLVALLVSAERVGRGAGLTRKNTIKLIQPILEQTLRNYLERGGAAAFSGPIRRGDVETIRGHLRELRRVSEAGEVYRSLVRSALRDLPAKHKGELRKVLGRQG